MLKRNLLTKMSVNLVFSIFNAVSYPFSARKWFMYEKKNRTPMKTKDIDENDLLVTW